MTKTGEAARPPMELDADSLLDIIRLRQREITIAAIALVAVGLVGWFWRDTTVKKEGRAERALNLASNSYFAGNAALAKTDLEKMVDRYAGTAAAVQGSMLLAQVLYEGSQYDEGIKKLEAVTKWGAAKPFAASLEGLVASGFSEQKKYEEASKRYLVAADKARLPSDRDLFRGDAARALMAAGKKNEAKKIWAELASRMDSPEFGEAKIRLGELEASAVTKH